MSDQQNDSPDEAPVHEPSPAEVQLAEEVEAKRVELVALVAKVNGLNNNNGPDVAADAERVDAADLTAHATEAFEYGCKLLRAATLKVVPEPEAEVDPEDESS